MQSTSRRERRPQMVILALVLGLAALLCAGVAAQGLTTPGRAPKVVLDSFTCP